MNTIHVFKFNNCLHAFPCWSLFQIFYHLLCFFTNINIKEGKANNFFIEVPQMTNKFMAIYGSWNLLVNYFEVRELLQEEQIICWSLICQSSLIFLLWFLELSSWIGNGTSRFSRSILPLPSIWLYALHQASWKICCGGVGCLPGIQQPIPVIPCSLPVVDIP